MKDKEFPSDYTRRIDEVINFILKNLTQELSLEKLAGIASYSPFHFQKLFKEVVGETPKQYIVRTRLETAAHFLIMHRFKSVSEVAFDCGFSSPGIFARAFKNYFGITPDELRKIPMKERLKLYKKGDSNKQLLDTDINFTNSKLSKLTNETTLKIVVKKISTIQGIFTNSTIHSENKIQDAYKKIIQLANNHDLLSSDSVFLGIIYPHQNLYRAMVTTKPHLPIIKGLHASEIPAGKYATFKVTGTIESTFKLLLEFSENWLPENGYRVSDISGFEILSENPISKPYNKIEREVYIRIEPA